MADASPHLLATSISCHAWSADCSMVAICPHSADLEIFEAPLHAERNDWRLVASLSKHQALLSAVHWAPLSDRIVTCSYDRNAYVWERSSSGTAASSSSSNNLGIPHHPSSLPSSDSTFSSSSSCTWVPVPVILRCSRAALCCAWSPKENKFAVGSAAATVSICFFDSDNNWWVSKVIKKKHDSSVTSVAWHPNNLLLATTSTDGKCRVFSAAIKTVDANVESSLSSSPAKFGEQLLQLDLAFGWAFGVKWSPSGDNLAFVGHDSSIHFVNNVGPSLSVHSLPIPQLPLRDVAFLSDRFLVAAGFGANPLLFAADSTGAWSFLRVLDEEKGAALSPPSSMISAASFDSPSRRIGTEAGDRDRSGTVHQACITCLRGVGPPRGGVLQSFSSSGLDGRLVVWDISGLHLSNTLRSLNI